MDISPDPTEMSIVAAAASSGSGAMIDVVVAAMSNLLNKDRVGMVAVYQFHDDSMGWSRGERVAMVLALAPRSFSPDLSAVFVWRECRV